MEGIQRTEVCSSMAVYSTKLKMGKWEIIYNQKRHFNKKPDMNIALDSS